MKWWKCAKDLKWNHADVCWKCGKHVPIDIHSGLKTTGGLELTW